MCLLGFAEKIPDAVFRGGSGISPYRDLELVATIPREEGSSSLRLEEGSIWRLLYVYSALNFPNASHPTET